MEEGNTVKWYYPLSLSQTHVKLLWHSDRTNYPPSIRKTNMRELHTAGKKEAGTERNSSGRLTLRLRDFVANPFEQHQQDECLAIGLVLFKLPRTGSTLLTSMVSHDSRVKIVEEHPALTMFFLTLEEEEERGLEGKTELERTTWEEEKVFLLRKLLQLLALRTAPGQLCTFFNLGSLSKPTLRAVRLLKLAAPSACVVYQHRRAAEVAASMLLKPPQYILEKGTSPEERASAVAWHVVASVRAARASLDQLKAVLYYKDVVDMSAIARLRKDWCRLPALAHDKEEEFLVRARGCLSVHSKTGKPFSVAVERQQHQEVPEELLLRLKEVGPDVMDLTF